jgi:hypothetical protein
MKPAYLVLVALSGCTVEMMQRMSKPTDARPPDHEPWPEIEPLIRHASADWVAASPQRLEVMRVYTPKARWQERNLERATGVWLISRERGGASVKGATGDRGVCFLYNCSLVQRRRTGDRLDSPFFDCDTIPEKLTCQSVERLPPTCTRRR